MVEVDLGREWKKVEGGAWCLWPVVPALHVERDIVPAELELV